MNDMVAATGDQEQPAAVHERKARSDDRDPGRRTSSGPADIESVFATVRHRIVRMKGALSQDTARLMVFKLVMAASKSWRRLQGQNQLPKLVGGETFKDGIEVAFEKKSAA
jgi:hypothetical protein